MGHVYGYARVSTTEQNSALQRDSLKVAGAERIFTDKASGKLDRRPQLDKLLDLVLPGDTIVVWRPDRLGRSIRHLIDVVGDLGERGVGFKSLTEAIDTTTASGRLLFHIMGALAEFERQLIVERTHAGLAAARARGRHGGRPTVMNADKIRIARQMYDSREHTIDAIARTIGVGRSTVYRHLEAGERSGPRQTAPAVTD